MRTIIKIGENWTFIYGHAVINDFRKMMIWLFLVDISIVVPFTRKVLPVSNEPQTWCQVDLGTWCVC